MFVSLELIKKANLENCLLRELAEGEDRRVTENFNLVTVASLTPFAELLLDKERKS